MRKELEKLVAYLEDQQRLELDEHDYGIAQAYEIAAKKLKEILAKEERGDRHDMEHSHRQLGV